MLDLPAPTNWFRGVGDDGEDVAVPFWRSDDDMTPLWVRARTLLDGQPIVPDRETTP